MFSFVAQLYILLSCDTVSYTCEQPLIPKKRYLRKEIVAVLNETTLPQLAVIITHLSRDDCSNCCLQTWHCGAFLLMYGDLMYC